MARKETLASLDCGDLRRVSSDSDFADQLLARCEVGTRRVAGSGGRRGGGGRDPAMNTSADCRRRARLTAEDEAVETFGAGEAGVARMAFAKRAFAGSPLVRAADAEGETILNQLGNAVDGLGRAVVVVHELLDPTQRVVVGVAEPEGDAGLDIERQHIRGAFAHGSGVRF
jgi:hypothetical protein